MSYRLWQFCTFNWNTLVSIKGTCLNQKGISHNLSDINTWTFDSTCCIPRCWIYAARAWLSVCFSQAAGNLLAVLWMKRMQLPRRHPFVSANEGSSPSHIIKRSPSRALPFVWEKGSVMSGRRISTGFTPGPDLGVPPTAELSESGWHWHFPDRISETLSSSALNEAQSRFVPFQVGREESFCSSTAMKIFP